MARGLAIAFLLSFGPAVANSFTRFAYALVLPSMRADLQWTWSQAGTLNTVNAVGYLLGALAVRVLVVRVGNRRLFCAGMIVASLALLGTGLVRDFAALNAMRIVAGLGGAAVFICGGALSGNVFPDRPERGSLTIAVYFAGGGIGLILCGVSIPWLLDAMGDAGWPIAWRGMGLAALAMSVASLWAAAAIAEPGTPRGGARTDSSRWPLRPFLGELAGYACFALGYIGYMTFVIAWMRTHGAGTDAVTAVWVVLGLATLLAPVLWSGPAERWSGGRPLAAVMAMLAIGAAIPLVQTGTGWMMLSAALFGGSMFSAPSSISSLVEAVPAQARLGIGAGDLHRGLRGRPDRRPRRDRLDGRSPWVAVARAGRLGGRARPGRAGVADSAQRHACGRARAEPAIPGDAPAQGSPEHDTQQRQGDPETREHGAESEPDHQFRADRHAHGLPDEEAEREQPHAHGRAASAPSGVPWVCSALRHAVEAHTHHQAAEQRHRPGGGGREQQHAGAEHDRCRRPAPARRTGR
jgi:MFS family permease